MQPVETDLGEYICQLADDPPSHIIAPAMHKSQDEIADLFVKHHGTPRLDRAERLTREAREKLREHFLSADLGISSGNRHSWGWKTRSIFRMRQPCAVPVRWCAR